MNIENVCICTDSDGVLKAYITVAEGYRVIRAADGEATLCKTFDDAFECAKEITDREINDGT